MAGSKVTVFSSRRTDQSTRQPCPSVLRVHTLRIEQGKTLSSVQGLFYQEEQPLVLHITTAVSQE